MDRKESEFEMLSPEEMEDWVAEFVSKSMGDDLNAVCTLAMIVESMDSFINKDDKTRKEFMKFCLRREALGGLQFTPLYEKYQMH